MGTKILKGKFMPQYRTAAQWRAADPVLLRGELAVESDTLKFKFGDGTTTWNNLEYVGGGADSSEVIMISDAESISKAVTSVEWRELGQIRPVIIFDPAGVAGLPADVPSNCTLVGNVQKVDDGTISSDDGYVVTLNVFQEDNFLSGIWYQILLNSAGEVIEEKKYLLGGNAGESLPFDGPIPGYTKLTAGEIYFGVAPGTLSIINFGQEVSPSTVMFADVEVRCSVTSGSARAVVPLTFFKPIQAATIFDLNTRSLASGTAIGQIRLNIATVVTGANGIAGLQVVVTSNNLANAGDIIFIKGIYAKIRGGEIVTPDKYYLTVNGKTSTGSGAIPITLSPDSDAQILELPFTTNGTLKIAAKTGSFLNAQIVSGEEAEIETTENSGTIQIEISANTGSLRHGSVTLALVENNDVQCMIAISQNSGGGNPNNDAVIHVDCYDTGLEAGQEIFLVFEVAGFSENYDCVVPDDKEILIKFSEVADILGFDLLGCAGDSLTIRCPNIDVSDTQTIPDDYVDMTFHFI